MEEGQDGGEVEDPLSTGPLKWNIYQNTLNTLEISLICKIIHFWISTGTEDISGEVKWSGNTWTVIRGEAEGGGSH